MLPMPQNRTPLTLWTYGTIASVLLAFVLLIPQMGTGQKVPLRYWFFIIGPGSIIGGFVAWVATKPTQQTVLNQMQETAETMLVASDNTQEASRKIAASTETLTTTAEQFAEQFQQFHAASNSLNSHATTDRRSAAPPVVSQSVPHSRVHLPRSPQSAPQPTEEEERKIDLLLHDSSGNDFGFRDEHTGDLWGSSNPPDRHAG